MRLTALILILTGCVAAADPEGGAKSFEDLNPNSLVSDEFYETQSLNANQLQAFLENLPFLEDLPGPPSSARMPGAEERVGWPSTRSKVAISRRRWCPSRAPTASMPHLAGAAAVLQLHRVSGRATAMEPPACGDDVGFGERRAPGGSVPLQLCHGRWLLRNSPCP